MAAFTDATGREWVVVVTFGHLKPMREKHGIDTKAKIRDFLQSLGDTIGDPDRLYLLLLLLCADQIEREKLDPESFARVLSGDALRQAAAAVSDAILDFCQGPTVGMETGEAVRAAMQAVDEKGAAALRTERPKLMSRISAGSSPASPGVPTPTPEPSAN